MSKRFGKDSTSSRNFLCFPQRKRMFFGAELYVSALENIRFRIGKLKNKTGMSRKTGLRFSNPFHNFEMPFLFRIFKN